MNDYRILVVDDEEDLCEILKFNLENEGYFVDTANSAEEALKMELTQYDLLLLDVMMGEISGFKMANMLKKNKATASIPIIFITAKDTENDTVTGFNLGADDYISKPFSLREVIARVKAVLRRTSPTQGKEAQEQLQYKGLLVDITKKKVSIDGIEISLTKKEFEILLLLLQNKGRVFSREDILAKVWQEEVYVLDRTIDVNITRLRKKNRRIRKMHRHPPRIRILFNKKLFLSVISLFIAFAICFMAFQYRREKEYKIELLNTQLQNYNDRLNDFLRGRDTLNIQQLNDYVCEHTFEDLRVTLINKNGTVIYDNLEKDPSHFENHHNRQEIKEAIIYGSGYSINRQSESLGGEFFYSAKYYPNLDYNHGTETSWIYVRRYGKA